MKRRHWYHCTTDDHGATWFPALRPPSTRGHKEPTTPRLCVCRTIPQCFTGALFTRGPVFVYRTAKQRRTVAPRGVWDEPVTRERWLIPPVEMIHVATINRLWVERAQGLVIKYHRTTRKNSDLYLKIAGYSIAVETLGTSDVERMTAARYRGYCKMDDAERYILDKIRAFERTKELCVPTTT